MFGANDHVNTNPVQSRFDGNAKALARPLQECIALSPIQSKTASPGAKK